METGAFHMIPGEELSGSADRQGGKTAGCLGEAGVGPEWQEPLEAHCAVGPALWTPTGGGFPSAHAEVRAVYCVPLTSQ